MFKPEKNNYGYGWGIVGMHGKQLYSHSGGIHGFSTVIHRFPEDKVLVVVLSNNMSALVL